MSESGRDADALVIQESALFQRIHDRTAREFLRRTGATRAQRLLSLGCGDGAIERRLAPHVGEIVGVDICAAAIERARLRAATAGLANLSFAVADGARGAPAPGTFDLVAAFAFLHHLSDEELGSAMRGARRALRPGGLFYSIDPSAKRLVRHFAACVRTAYDRHHSPDERELEPTQLVAHAVAAGFVAPVVDYVDYFVGPLAWLEPPVPGALARTLVALDDLALRLPGMRRFASSFCLLARCGEPPC